MTSLKNLLIELHDIPETTPIDKIYNLWKKILRHPDMTPSLRKKLRECVYVHPGYIIGGADFSALEERIGAILSNDPNRIAVYTQGLDGHSMRTIKYFPDQMQDIVQALAKADTATIFYRKPDGSVDCI